MLSLKMYKTFDRVKHNARVLNLIALDIGVDFSLFYKSCHPKGLDKVKQCSVPIIKDSLNPINIRPKIDQNSYIFRKKIQRPMMDQT